MRVLMAIEWHPLTPGGVQRHVRELSTFLVKLGFEVAILTKLNSRVSGELQFDAPIIYVDPAIPIQNPISPPNLGSLKRVISDFSPDIVHAHHAFTPTPLLTLHVAERFGVPRVLTNHSAAGSTPSSALTLMSCRGLMFLRYFISKANRIISVSKCAASFIENLLGNGAESLIIPNGVDVHRFHPPESEPDEQVVLYVGRLVHRKGVHVLIKAFSRVVREVPDAKLLVVGEGYMLPFLKMLVWQFDLNGKVRFLGRVSEDRLPSIYRRSRVVVMPSLYRESFGIVALEAMASGRPIIASAVGGLPEVVCDGASGFLVPPGNEVLLAERIVQLLCDRDLAWRMGMAGREIAVKRYSWERIASLVASVYGEVLGKAFEVPCEFAKLDDA
ncbi:MAG: glycosyltransferase family 4 protein [archaeon GB-1867-005]|nr:glycosyltransferase family 4 protein [Candidatus Culexmicrobium cathedralense]